MKDSMVPSLSAVNFQHYLRHIRPQIDRAFASSLPIGSQQDEFQHVEAARFRAASPDELERFAEAMTLKLGGLFDDSRAAFEALLELTDLPSGLRSEAHYQAGDVTRMTEAPDADWVGHMSAAHSYRLDDFRPVQELDRWFDALDQAPAKPGKQRVLLILGSNAATVAFANAFLDEFEVVGLIQEYAKFPRLPRAFAPIQDRPFGLTKAETVDFIDEAVLGPRWNALFMDSTIPQLHIRRGEANTAYVMAWVESLGPDVIVSHGPERLRGEFIGLAKRGGVNVHWGLSPTYRGMDTTRWPLIHGEPEWIGVTIHRLDPGLDTGPILYQAKPDLVAGDTYRQIEYRLTNLACEIVPVAVREIMDGSERPIHQDLTLGRQYWADEWTHRHQQMLTKDYIVEQIEAYHADKNARDHATPLINPWSER